MCLYDCMCTPAPVANYRRPVRSVGWASDYRAVGRGFKPRSDQHSGSLTNWGESAAFVSWLDFLVFSEKDDKP